MAALVDPITTKSSCCSFHYTGPVATSQHTYICHTCTELNTSKSELLCVCESCATECHDGHDLGYIGLVDSYCDCGDKCKVIAQSRIAAAKYTSRRRRKTTQTDKPESKPKPDFNHQFESYNIPSLPSLTKLLQEHCVTLTKTTKETHWISASKCGLIATNSYPTDSPLHPLECLASRIFEFHKSKLGPFDPDFTGAEWWVQVKDVGTAAAAGGNKSSAIDLHYDKDEELAADFNIGRFPTLSTVTYLNTSANGSSQGLAPTIIFDHKYDTPQDKPIEAAIVSFPVEGKHIVFDGRLLHGVPANEELKGMGMGMEMGMEMGMKKKGGETSRVTFMVNLWKDEIPAIEALDVTAPGMVVGGDMDVDMGMGMGVDFGTGKLEFEKLEEEQFIITERDVDVEAKPVMLHFVSSGATWDGNEESGENENENEENGEEPPAGLMLFMLQPLPKINTIKFSSAKLVYEEEDICPRLVNVGEDDEEYEEEEEGEEMIDDEIMKKMSINSTYL